MNLIGKLTIDEDNELSLKMRISPGNPEEYDIPLKELFDDLIGKKIKIEALSIEPRLKG
jgi:hypothetical protein